MPHVKSCTKQRIRTMLAAAFALLAAGAVQAGTITVSWDAVNDPALTGYRLFWGSGSGSYSQSLDLGTIVTSHTIPALADCTTYYIALKSLDDQGLESGSFSPEIAGFTRPTVSSVSPSLLYTGSVVSVVVSGTSFEPGATLAFSRPGLSVQSLSVDACGQLTATLAVDLAMAAGTVDLTVMNPGGVPAGLAAAFLVQVNVAPTSVTNLRRTDATSTP